MITAETSSDDESQNANRRVLIQIYYERINHLASLILNLDGFIIAILVGIIVGAFAIREKNPSDVTILIFIGIVSLIGWRIHSHKIDNQIVKFYGQVINCEKKLKVEEDFSLLKKLVGKYDKLYPQLEQQSPESKFKFIVDRIPEKGLETNSGKKFHDRGHYFRDLMAYFAIILLVEFFIVKPFLIDEAIIRILFFGFLGIIVYGHLENEL